MTTIVKARDAMQAMRTRREEMESEFAKIYEGIKETEASSAERILNGANVDEEAKRIADQRAKREALAAAIELSKEREKQTADALYQKELEQAWIDARKIWRSDFAKIDKLGATVRKLVDEGAKLAETRNKLIRMGAAFTKTEGASMFNPEAQIIGQAAHALQTLKKQWSAIEQARTRYEEAYTDERKKG